MANTKYYETWLGDTLMYSGSDKDKALTEFNKLPSGEGMSPFKRRLFRECKDIKKDGNGKTAN